jgi:hypothetical protein
MRFVLDGRTPFLGLPREEALDLFEHLGLGRPEFGAIEVSMLVPLCRRRLWPEKRNDGPLRAHVAALAAAIRWAPAAVVLFGCRA